MAVPMLMLLFPLLLTSTEVACRGDNECSQKCKPPDPFCNPSVAINTKILDQRTFPCKDDQKDRKLLQWCMNHLKTIKPRQVTEKVVECFGVMEYVAGFNHPDKNSKEMKCLNIIKSMIVNGGDDEAEKAMMECFGIIEGSMMIDADITKYPKQQQLVEQKCLENFKEGRFRHFEGKKKKELQRSECLGIFKAMSEAVPQEIKIKIEVTAPQNIVFDPKCEYVLKHHPKMSGKWKQCIKNLESIVQAHIPKTVNETFVYSSRPGGTLGELIKTVITKSLSEAKEECTIKSLEEDITTSTPVETTSKMSDIYSTGSTDSQLSSTFEMSSSTTSDVLGSLSSNEYERITSLTSEISSFSPSSTSEASSSYSPTSTYEGSLSSTSERSSSFSASATPKTASSLYSDRAKSLPSSTDSDGLLSYTSEGLSSLSTSTISERSESPYTESTTDSRSDVSETLSKLPLISTSKSSQTLSLNTELEASNLPSSTSSGWSAHTSSEGSTIVSSTPVSETSTRVSPSTSEFIASSPSSSTSEISSTILSVEASESSSSLLPSRPTEILTNVSSTTDSESLSSFYPSMITQGSSTNYSETLSSFSSNNISKGSTLESRSSEHTESLTTNMTSEIYSSSSLIPSESSSISYSENPMREFSNTPLESETSESSIDTSESSPISYSKNTMRTSSSTPLESEPSEFSMATSESSSIYSDDAMRTSSSTPVESETSESSMVTSESSSISYSDGAMRTSSSTPLESEPSESSLGTSESSSTEFFEVEMRTSSNTSLESEPSESSMGTSESSPISYSENAIRTSSSTSLESGPRASSISTPESSTSLYSETVPRLHSESLPSVYPTSELEMSSSSDSEIVASLRPSASSESSSFYTTPASGSFTNTDSESSRLHSNTVTEIYSSLSFNAKSKLSTKTSTTENPTTTEYTTATFPPTTENQILLIEFVEQPCVQFKHPPPYLCGSKLERDMILMYSDDRHPLTCRSIHRIRDMRTPPTVIYTGSMKWNVGPWIQISSCGLSFTCYRDGPTYTIILAAQGNTKHYLTWMARDVKACDLLKAFHDPFLDVKGGEYKIPEYPFSRRSNMQRMVLQLYRNSNTTHLEPVTISERDSFSIKDFVFKHDLCGPVAATEFFIAYPRRRG